MLAANGHSHAVVTDTFISPSQPAVRGLTDLTIDVVIRRSAEDTYAFAHLPQNFAAWASGLGGELKLHGRQWRSFGPDGWISVRFSAPNRDGILDHWVRPDGADEIHIPLHVRPCGEHAVVSLTLLRAPGVSDESFARDAAWVRRDLETLKAILEAEAPPAA